jgi:hypothetical protein
MVVVMTIVSKGLLGQKVIVGLKAHQGHHLLSLGQKVTEGIRAIPAHKAHLALPVIREIPALLVRMERTERLHSIIYVPIPRYRPLIPTLVS